jgi:hypothetical protein
MYICIFIYNLCGNSERLSEIDRQIERVRERERERERERDRGSHQQSFGAVSRRFCGGVG